MNERGRPDSKNSAVRAPAVERLRAGRISFRRRLGGGLISALVGAALWGFSGTCAQFLLSRYTITPLFITAARMLIAGLLFLIVLFVFQRQRLCAMIRHAPTLRRLVVFGAGTLFVSQVTYVAVVGLTNAGTATVLQCSGIVFVLLFSCVIARSIPAMREVIGVLAALVATWLIATQGNPSTLSLPILSLVWGTANGLTVAFSLMYPQPLFARWGSLAVTGVGMFFGGIAASCTWLLSGLVSGVFDIPVLDMAGVFALIVIVVVGTFAAFGLYLHGVSLVGSVKGSLLGAIEPASATICSAVWLGTVFSPADWMGFVLMIAMIFLVSKRKV